MSAVTAKELEAASAPPIVARALTHLLIHIGSWTSARFDQHLRYEFGDEVADEVLAWLAAHVSPALGLGPNGEPAYRNAPRTAERSSDVSMLLHRLWTRAVGTQGYVKSDWLALEASINALQQHNGR